MWISRYDLTTLEYIDQFDLSGLEGGNFYQLVDIGYGLSVDGIDKVYAVDNDANQALRADIPTLLGDFLVGSSGSGNDNFSSPTFSAIINYPAAPVASSVSSFGTIIW